jgi:hypothetical protein
MELQQILLAAEIKGKREARKRRLSSRIPKTIRTAGR